MGTQIIANIIGGVAGRDGIMQSVQAGTNISVSSADPANPIVSATGLQPLDADLTAIAALSPSNDDIVQRKSGVWTNRTAAQYKADLSLNNVDNTSDATKNAASATLANKTLTTPIIASFVNATHDHSNAAGGGAIANPYKFSVYLAANQTGIVDGVATKVLFDTEAFDTNNNFASNKYTVPVTGYYQINSYLSVAAASNNGVAGNIFLYKNGSELIRGGGEYPNFGTGTTGQTAMYISDIVSLTATDTLEIYASLDVLSGTVTVAGGSAISRFSGFLVSTT